MSEYTLGPWIKDGLHLVGRNGDTVVVSDGPAFGSRSDWSHAEANARLICAAPDLLEALEKLLEDHEGFIHSEFDGTDAISGILDELEYARAAIAKARGN